VKKLCLILVVMLAIGITSHKADSNTCWTIEEGNLLASTGEPLTLGYDQFGYNYQAHIFNGSYCDYDRVVGGDDCDVDLVMKWNDAWLSNKSCDGDPYLDRPGSYIGSGAWCTNHQSGKVADEKGKLRKWTYFVKIVAAPADAIKYGDKWYTDSTLEIEIGLVIWGSFAIIQRVLNDPSVASHGVVYKSPVGPGFGKF